MIPPTDFIFILFFNVFLLCMVYFITYIMDKKGYSFPKIKMKEQTRDSIFIKFIIFIGLLRDDDIEIEILVPTKYIKDCTDALCRFSRCGTSTKDAVRNMATASKKLKCKNDSGNRKRSSGCG